jgi:hypothetical protein
MPHRSVLIRLGLTLGVLLLAVGPAAADLTTDLCGRAASRGGQTVVSEGVKTSFAIDIVQGRRTAVESTGVPRPVGE